VMVVLGDSPEMPELLNFDLTHEEEEKLGWTGVSSCTCHFYLLHLPIFCCCLGLSTYFAQPIVTNSHPYAVLFYCWTF